ncbi:MAG: hypothetical protein ACON5F_00020, partial [Jejuia sp.]
DGIDGLAITEVIKTIVIIELFSSTPTPLVALGGLTIACLLPLYYFNFRKSKKVFLGDAGSLFLGTLVMVYLLYVLGPNYQFKDGYQLNKVLFAVLVVLYPLVDLLRVFFIRIKNNSSPFTPDKNHIHHFLKNLEWKEKKIILIIMISEFILLLTIFYLQ